MVRLIEIGLLSVALACSGCSGEPGQVFGHALLPIETSLVVEVVGRGTVNVGKASPCQSLCSFPSDRPQQLVGQADQGWRFAGFSGACEGFDCMVESGRVVASFVKREGVEILVTGRGFGRVTTSRGDLCTKTCFLETNVPLDIDIVADDGSRARFLNCNTPCRASPGSSVSVSFDPTRRVNVRVRGGAGEVDVNGQKCTSQCQFSVEPTTALSLRASGVGLSHFMTWAAPMCPRATQNECAVQAGELPVDVEAVFDSPVLFETDARYLQQTVSIGGAIGVGQDRIAAHFYSPYLGVELRGIGVLPPPSNQTSASSHLVQFDFDGGVRAVTQFHSQLAPNETGGTALQYLAWDNGSWLGLGNCGSRWQRQACPTGPHASFVVVEADGGVSDAGVFSRSRTLAESAFRSATGLGVVATTFGLASAPATSSLYAPLSAPVDVPAYLHPCVQGNQGGRVYCLATWNVMTPWHGCTPTQPLIENRQLVEIDTTQPSAPRCQVLEQVTGMPANTLLMSPAVLAMGAQEDVWLVSNIEEPVVLQQLGQQFSSGIVAVAYHPGRQPRAVLIDGSVRTFGFHESAQGTLTLLTQTSAVGSELGGLQFGVGWQLSRFTSAGEMLRTDFFENAQTATMATRNGVIALLLLGDGIRLRGTLLAAPSARRYHVIALRAPD